LEDQRKRNATESKPQRRAWHKRKKIRLGETRKRGGTAYDIDIGKSSLSKQKGEPSRNSWRKGKKGGEFLERSAHRVRKRSDVASRPVRKPSSQHGRGGPDQGKESAKGKKRLHQGNIAGRECLETSNRTERGEGDGAGAPQSNEKKPIAIVEVQLREIHNKKKNCARTKRPHPGKIKGKRNNLQGKKGLWVSRGGRGTKEETLETGRRAIEKGDTGTRLRGRGRRGGVSY